MNKPKVNHDKLFAIAKKVGLTMPFAAVLSFATSPEVQPFIGWPDDVDEFMTAVQAACDMSTVMFARFEIDNEGAEAVVVVWN